MGSGAVRRRNRHAHGAGTDDQRMILALQEGNRDDRAKPPAAPWRRWETSKSPCCQWYLFNPNVIADTAVHRPKAERGMPVTRCTRCCAAHASGWAAAGPASC